jgi:hypothetical protein
MDPSILREIAYKSILEVLDGQGQYAVELTVAADSLIVIVWDLASKFVSAGV